MVVWWFGFVVAVQVRSERGQQDVVVNTNRHKWAKQTLGWWCSNGFGGSGDGVFVGGDRPNRWI